MISKPNVVTSRDFSQKITKRQNEHGLTIVTIAIRLPIRWRRVGRPRHFVGDRDVDLYPALRIEVQLSVELQSAE